MQISKLLLVATLGVLLAGSGCLPVNQQPQEQSISYSTYNNLALSLSFDVPANATLHDGVNGFEDMWKFEYNGDSYIVSFNQFKDGAAVFAGWDDARPAGAPAVQVSQLADRTVYSLVDMASTEVFFTNTQPITSIRVDKQTGTALNGAVSSSNDVVFAHLVASVKIKNEVAF